MKTFDMVMDGDVWVDVTRCTLCKSCLDVCPTSAIIYAPEGTISIDTPDGTDSWTTAGYVRINTDNCIQCDQCIPVCPYDAIHDHWPLNGGGYPAPNPGTGTEEGPSGNPPNPTPGATASYVASGSNTSAYDVASLMLTSLGVAASHADIAANAARLEATALSGFKTASRIFGAIDIASNLIEFYNEPNWEDAGQAVLGIALTFGALNPATAIVGGIILTAWELWEYKREH